MVDRIYIIAAAVTTLIFMVGVSFGMFLSNEKVESLKSEYEQLEFQRKNLELEFLLMNSLDPELTCEMLYTNLNSTIDEVARLGDLVDLYDNSEKLKAEEFESLKKDYIILTIKYWLFWQEMKTGCGLGKDTVTILYFYSNKNCNDCLTQGAVLSFFKQKNPEEVMVFALDGDSDIHTIQILKQIFKITEYPSIVVNNEKYAGFVPKRELAEILRDQNPKLVVE